MKILNFDQYRAKDPNQDVNRTPKEDPNRIKKDFNPAEEEAEYPTWKGYKNKNKSAKGGQSIPKSDRPESKSKPDKQARYSSTYTANMHL